jgi:hypothetical protein
VGVLLLYFPPGGASIQMAAVLVAALVGAALGVWIAGMMGLQVPNTQLKGFEQEIQEGKILLMLDVPASRYEEVRNVIARSQPQAVNRGNEPMVPAFP